MTTIGKVSIIPSETNVFRKKCGVEWEIPIFSALSAKQDHSYISPLFVFANETWYFRIYPNGHYLRKSVGHVGLYLMKKSSGLPIVIKYSLGLKRINGKKYLEHYRMYIYKNKEEGNGVHSCIPRSELFERKSDLLRGDVLTVFCNVKYFKFGETPSENVSQTSPVLSKKRKILQDFKDLFLNKEDCDVVLRVKGQEFPAHRVILKTRSPVFASTFRSDMKEKVTGIVDIEDCDPSSFSDFLCFLYSEDVGIFSPKNVFSLFTTADKYDVSDLREKCMEYIKRNLSVDTFCETITLALQHTETELINLTTDFFIKNAEKILVSVKWQSFAAENPTQSNELFIKFVASDRCSKV